MDRAGVNKSLLDAIEEMPNVKIFFGHRLTGADFRKCQAWFEVKNEAPGNDGLGRGREIQVDFDLMIGADGAHSAVRYHMMKFTRMNYSQKYIDTLWCEFQIPPRAVARKDDVMAKFAISPNHLHIWPGKEFMFIAIPSEVCFPNWLIRFPTNIGSFSLRMDHSHALFSCPVQTFLAWRWTLHPCPVSSTHISPV